MYKSFLMIAFAVFILMAQDNDETLRVQDSSVLMVNTVTHKKKSKSEEKIEFVFNFIGGKPLYFYETQPSTNSIIVKLNNTMLGGFFEGDSTINISAGPLKNVLIHQELKNKNEEVQGLKAEWYYLTTATFKCVPLVKDETMLTFTETESSLSINIVWPSDKRKREEMYLITEQKKKSHKGIWIASGIGVGVLGAGGFLLWHNLKNGDDGSLKTVLPPHGQ